MPMIVVDYALIFFFSAAISEGFFFLLLWHGTRHESDAKRSIENKFKTYKKVGNYYSQ